jgi:DUF4097 and DUF4098 domain-containing protein YvlB
MKPRFTLLLVVFLVPMAVRGARFAVTDQMSRTLPLDSTGSVWVENETGAIEIVGHDQPGIEVNAAKSIRGTDEAAIAEGRQQTQLVLSGDRRISYIRTIMPPVRSGRWASEVAYTLKVPKTASVNIASHSSNIRVRNVTGRITVKNVNGTISLGPALGPVIVESINGAIVVDGRPSGDSQLTTVSGDIEMRVPANASLEWVADSISRDFRTTLPIRGEFVGKTFRGSVRNGGPTIRTATLLGTILLLKSGTVAAAARPVQTLLVGGRRTPAVAPPKVTPHHRVPIVDGNYNYTTTVGDVSIGQVRGSARIETGGGEVHLDTVLGECHVISVGGPLELGEVSGTLVARTGAGDVTIRSALRGGLISTSGGMVRVDYAAGPTNITTLGGDIIVGRADAGVIADTRSGDITITAAPGLKKARFQARTAQGNVVLNLPPSFGADIEATVVATDVQGEMIRSDFRGLSITRDQVDGKTRIRAVGKINGGGERMELSAEGGRITIGRTPR